MICECGCGQETTIAQRSDKRYGTVKGLPLRWCIGHHNSSRKLSDEERRKRRREARKRWEESTDYKNSEAYKEVNRKRTRNYMAKNNPKGYSNYKAMIRRCYNPKQVRYENYGGIGITVCERWKHSFTAFLEDLGNRPSKEHTIGRALDLGNYEPGNAWWMSKEEQRLNKALKKVLAPLPRHNPRPPTS